MIFVSNCFKKGMSRSTKRSIPGFWSPTAFNIPPYTSATRGAGFPGHGTFATPFVTTAPNLFRSTNSAYSAPEPNVPEAVMTGLFKVTPHKSTFMFIRILPPLHGIQVLLYRFVCSSRCCVRLFLLTDIHRQGTHQYRMPYAPPWRSSTRCDFSLHILLRHEALALVRRHK